MRKALLVVALIASSFAGGAVVNGPGLKVVEAWVADQVAGGPAPSTGGPEVSEPEAFPSAPLPRITGPDEVSVEAAVAEPPVPPAEPAAAVSAPAPEAVAAAGPPALAAPSAEPAPTSTTSAEPARPLSTPAAAAAPAPASVPPLTPPAATAPAAAAPPAVADGAPAAPPAPADVPAPPVPKPGGAPAAAGTPWSDAPDSKAPATAVVPDPSKAPAGGAGGGGEGPSLAAAEPAAGPAPLAAADGAVVQAGLEAAPAPPADRSWVDVARRLAELGVGRYWVEGEPGGAVRFRCTIPVAGERAVAQQFEAEGDTPQEAAETVLKRVALWRAVHEVAPKPGP